MSKFPMDLSQFKKIKDEKDHAILRHPHGHEFKIAKNALSPKMRAEMAKLPSVKMADGGEVADKKNHKLEYESLNQGKHKKLDYEPIKSDKAEHPVDYEALAEGGEVVEQEKKRIPGGNGSPAIDPNKAKSIENSAVEPGWYEARRNIRKLTGYAEGGDVIPSLNLDPNQQLPEEMINPSPGSQSNLQGFQPASPNPEDLPYGVSPEDMKAPEAPMAATAAPKDEMPAEPSRAPAEAPKNPEPALQAPDATHAYQQQLQAITGMGAEEAKFADQKALNAASQVKEAARIQNESSKHMEDLTNEYKSVRDDIAQGHIDPNHYMSSLSAGGKVATAIGLILGGIGGGGQSNAAMDFLNKQIDRDIEAQKAELGKKHTILSAVSTQFNHELDRTSMAKAMMLAAYDAQVKKAEAVAANPMAKLRAQQLSAQLEQSAAPLFQQIAMRKALASADPSSLKDMDPAQAVSMLVPKEHQAKVFGEIERAQDTKRMGDSILKAFDAAAKDVRPLSGGRVKNLFPGTESAHVLSLHQAMQPTFKDLEGTVRQAAMDNTFHNITPKFGNSDQEVAIKRKALVDYLQSKASAPVAKGFGIDLEKFGSTAARPESKLSPHQQFLVEWAKKNPENHKSAVLLKKLGI